MGITGLGRSAAASKLLVGLVAATLVFSACSTDESESADSQRQYLSAGGEEIPNDGAYDLTFFENYGVNPRIDTEDDPLSTFGLDVDTGSYTLARSWINDGNMPDKDSVRPEEYVNFFDQGYSPHQRESFAIYSDGGPSPFMENDRYQLVRVGVQSKVVDDRDRPDANLTFVVDVSGSMSGELPKVQAAMETLVDELRPSDQVAIVVYGDDSEVILRHTELSDSDEVFDAIDNLEVNGSTNAEEGLRLGYEQASREFDKNKINRVILLSDGVANVGNTGSDSIMETIKDSSKDGINLLTVGFGQDNYNDVLMEQLANDGDGFYAYVDSRREAERLFSEDLTGTLLTVAKDAKIQVEFNSETVERYRLIGFENRAIDDEDFDDEEIDAGEIGSGHTVTAMYEVKLSDSGLSSNDLAKVTLKWKDPESNDNEEFEHQIELSDLEDSYQQTDANFQLAATVVAWSEVLRESYFATENDVISLDAVAAEAERLADEEFNDNNDVKEFAELVNETARLKK